jgi:hypothetical protein
MTPGPLTRTSIAALPNGTVAEAVIDKNRNAYARLHTDGSWSPWRMVAASAADVSVDAAVVGSADVVYVSVAFEGYEFARGIYTLSAGGVAGADL